MTLQQRSTRRVRNLHRKDFNSLRISLGLAQECGRKLRCSHHADVSAPRDKIPQEDRVRSCAQVPAQKAKKLCDDTAPPCALERVAGKVRRPDNRSQDKPRVRKVCPAPRRRERPHNTADDSAREETRPQRFRRRNDFRADTAREPLSAQTVLAQVA